MKLLLAAMVGVVGLFSSAVQHPQAGAATAFVDVTVIPMDRERTLEHQAVVVSNGRIVAVGPVASTQIPRGAARIDGRGKFLIPGLVEMHAHFAPGGESITEPSGRQLALYMVTGFTTVRGLNGASSARALRDRIASDSLIGPRLIVGSPSVNGHSAHSVAEVVSLVEQAKRDRYDLIKTHGQFPSSDYYDSLVVAAKRAGLPLVGHVTPEYGLARAIAAHQQIEHLDGYIAAVMADGIQAPGGQLLADANLLTHVDNAKVKAVAEKTAKEGIWNDPTISLFETIASDETASELLARPEMQFATEAEKKQFTAQKTGVLANVPADGRARFIEVRRQLLRALHDAGAKLMTGSDSPQFFQLPGYGTIREIESFVRAGLSPYAALEAATRNPAEYLGTLADAGTVAAGKRADLVLLDANPLVDISNIRRLAGVMFKGHWMDKPALDSLKTRIAASANP